MTAATPAIPVRPGKAKLDIPRIRLLSWMGLETVIWSVVISHLVQWAGNFAYFAAWQVRYAVGYGKTLFTIWYLKDFWDRLPVHISNLLGSHWASQAAPLWWVTDRHLIRNVGIVLVATIIVQFMFTKPKHPADDQISLGRYIASVPLALAAAAVPIAAVGILAWQLPVLMHHGVEIPARFGGLASEVNGWLAAGTWIALVMGILGGIAAKRAVKRPADDVQWFIAERSAGHIHSTSGLDRLRGTRIIGTPIHRTRVRWLLKNKPDLPERSPWLVRILLAAGGIALAFAAAGAWLTLFGPAAVH